MSDVLVAIAAYVDMEEYEAARKLCYDTWREIEEHPDINAVIFELYVQEQVAEFNSSTTKE